MATSVKMVLESILDRFKSGEIPDAVAYSMFPIADIPSSQWSILNRTLMFLAGTQDSRGFRQWNLVNRYVKRGSKAFYILVPHIKKGEDRDTGEERSVLVGFMTRPVFRFEDTDGEPLDHEEIDLGDLPLIERAQEWGVEVKAIPGNYRYAGYYSSQKKVIALATKEQCVFWHELSHAAHDKLKGSLLPGQDPMQEIVAELAAQALCRLVGKTGDRHLGTSYRYIEGYAEKLKISAYAACLKVMTETEKVLNLILKGEAQAGGDIEQIAA